jgi:hypothetical protein
MKRGIAYIMSAAAIVAMMTLAPSGAVAQQKTVKACNEEYATNKDAIRGAGQKKVDFIAACRAGTETIPPTNAAAPAPAGSAATAPAPARPPVAAPKSTAPTAAVAPTGTVQFSTEAQAKAHCPSDTVVWANTNSKIYHFNDNRNYGNTKSGAYMCEADTVAAGIRAAKNEKHP